MVKLKHYLYNLKYLSVHSSYLRTDPNKFRENSLLCEGHLKQIIKKLQKERVNFRGFSEKYFKREREKNLHKEYLIKSKIIS